MEFKVPESLKEEHEALVEALKTHSARKDKTGAAVRDLLRILKPHMEKEDELVMPLLGLLGGLAAGGKPSRKSLAAIVGLREKYAEQYRGVFEEHVAIRRAIENARASAREGQGYDEVSETLDWLVHHAKIEEEALYPAALLVGQRLALSQQPNRALAKRVGRRGVASKKGPVEALANDGRGASPDGLSYFAFDYDEPISSVAERLKRKHDEIEAMLTEVEELADKGKLRVAISLLNAISPLTLRSAVEEEARIMREVMQKHPDRARDSILATRKHRVIAEFLRHKLPELASRPADEARQEIIEFVGLVRDHVREEERASFSLANR